MSRKDYAAIAAILAKYRNIDASAPIGSTTAMLSLDLAEYFAADNPRFDRDRFFRATQEGK